MRRWRVVCECLNPALQDLQYLIPFKYRPSIQTQHVSRLTPPDAVRLSSLGNHALLSLRGNVRRIALGIIGIIEVSSNIRDGPRVSWSKGQAWYTNLSKTRPLHRGQKLLAHSKHQSKKPTATKDRGGQGVRKR